MKMGVKFLGVLLASAMLLAPVADSFAVGPGPDPGPGPNPDPGPGPNPGPGPGPNPGPGPRR